MPTDMLPKLTTGHILSIQGILGIIRWTHLFIIMYIHIQYIAQRSKKVTQMAIGESRIRTHDLRAIKTLAGRLSSLGHDYNMSESAKSKALNHELKFRVQKFSQVPIFLLKSTRSILLTMASYRCLTAVNLKKLSHFLPL